VGEWRQRQVDIAQVLGLARLPSQSVVRMDSLVITAIFMPRSFPLRVLSRDGVEKSLDAGTKMQMENMYEAYKRQLGLGGAAWYMTITSDLATKMWNKFEILREGGSKETLLQWYVNNSTKILSFGFKLHRILRAYTAVIMDSSDVRLMVTETAGNIRVWNEGFSGFSPWRIHI
jgi:hypothetical protein